MMTFMGIPVVCDPNMPDWHPPILMQHNQSLQDAIDSWLNAIGEKQRNLPTKPELKQCECGCETVGASRHSSWCPKYE
jgi:hypothetical protein